MGAAPGTVTFSSVKETSMSGGVNAATVARPSGGSIAFLCLRWFFCVLGVINSSFMLDMNTVAEVLLCVNEY